MINERVIESIYLDLSLFELLIHRPQEEENVLKAPELFALTIIDCLTL